MSDEAKVSIHDLIKRDIEPLADKLIKEQKDGITKLAKIMLDLGKAIDKPDGHMIRLFSKALDAESPLTANRLSRASRLLERLDEAESEADLDGDLKEIEAITEKLSNLENKLKHNYATIKEYQDKAKVALDQLSDAEGEAAEAWAAHEAWLRRYLDLANERLGDIKKASDQASKAAANRDSKALDAARKAGAALRDFEPNARKIQEGLSHVSEKVHPEKLTEDFQKQFERDRQKFQKIADDISGIEDQISKIQDQIEKLDIEPADAKKVSALLKIPGQYESKVKKALELDKLACGKALEAILKELKTPMPAKDILVKLEKAGLI